MSAPVAVVIPCYRQAHLLGEAVASCLAQEPPPAEIVVVDDGSPDDVAAAVGPFADQPSVRLVHRVNGGLSAARNTGLAQSTSPYLIFLDADDRLCPGAIAAGLACHEQHPGAAFVWGGYRSMDLDGRYQGWPSLPRPTPEPLLALLAGNVIGMHATVMYRRQPLLAAGGFLEPLRACEDWDVYLTIAGRHPIACHRHVAADYRRHAGGMSRDFIRLVDAGLMVLERHRPAVGAPAARRRAWRRGRLRLVGLNAKRAVVSGLKAGLRGDRQEPLAALRMVTRYATILLSLGHLGLRPRIGDPAGRGVPPAALPEVTGAELGVKEQT